VRSEQLETIKNKVIAEALASAHTHTIRTHLVSMESRRRLPELGVGKNLDPYSALSTYLDNREDIQDIADDMLLAAESLLAEIV